MKSNFPASVALVLRSEGGFVDNRADPGGATNMGITRATLSNWMRHPALIADVQALSVETATAIYQAQYWSAVQGDNLPAGVDFAAFDFAVNSGSATAIKKLQATLGVTVDGIIGPITLAAATKAEPVGVINALSNARLIYLQSLPTWGTFGGGWSKRVAAVKAAAIKMLAQSPAQPAPFQPLPKPQPIPSPAPTVKSAGLWGIAVAIFNIIIAFLKGLRK